VVPVIRRIRPADDLVLRAVRLRALQVDPQAFESAHESEVDRTADAWYERATASSNGEVQCIFIAEAEEGVVGMAGAFTPDGEPLVRQLYGMWVAPEARSAGIGASLVEAVIRWSSEGGAQGLRLWVVENNAGALRLYARAGFLEAGVRQPFRSNPGSTEILLHLPLGERG
jgi:ribosomal protein S18 acetylase RimI-like enzyme